MPTNFSDQQKDQFEAEGYLIVENFISDTTVDELRKLVIGMANYEKSEGQSYIYPFDKSGLTQRVWNLTNKNHRFRELLEIEELSEIMNFIFRRPTNHQLFHLSSFQANILHPGAERQKLHVDTPFPEPLPPWPAKANSIWLLDDFTEKNGATEIVPRSHRNTNKPTKKDDQFIDCKKTIAPRGSVLFTHGNLWHRAGANLSAKPRVGLLGSFAASYMKEIASEEDQSLVVSKEVKANASQRLSAILGLGHGIKEGALTSHDERTPALNFNHNPSI